MRCVHLLAPKGNRNVLKRGSFTAETITLRKSIVAFSRMARRFSPP
jgi:hypothetical protein